MGQLSQLCARVTQRGVFTLVICMLGSQSVLHAQSGDIGTGEVSAFGGGAFGLGGAHPAVGGSSGISFSKYGIGLIEVAFSPIGEDTVRHRTGPGAESSRLFDFNGSFHIRIPVRRRWAPYGIVGGGLLFDSFRVIPTRPPESESGMPVPPSPVIAVEEFNFGFHTGAGVRYYIREDWGIRPEFKVIISNRTYTRFTIGIFVNVSSDWL